MPSEFFKALGDETRLRLLLLIAQNKKLCVCDLEEATLDSQPKVSRHLAVLRKAGIVDSKKQGLWVYYSLSANLDSWQKNVIKNALKHNLDQIEAGQARLEEFKKHDNNY